MGNSINKILLFNPQKKFVAWWVSAFAMGKALGLNVATIRSACNGLIISYNKLYFRYWDKSLGLNLEKLEGLTLTDYDKLCGIDRKVYENSKMSRKGMKYNKKPKVKSPYYPFKTPQPQL